MEMILEKGPGEVILTKTESTTHWYFDTPILKLNSSGAESAGVIVRRLFPGK